MTRNYLGSFEDLFYNLKYNRLFCGWLLLINYIFKQNENFWVLKLGIIISLNALCNIKQFLRSDLSRNLIYMYV